MDKTYKEEFLDKAINLTDTILNKFCVGKRIWRGGEYCYGYKCTKKEMKQFIKEQEPTWDKETIEKLTNLNITKDNVLTTVNIFSEYLTIILNAMIQNSKTKNIA